VVTFTDRGIPHEQVARMGFTALTRKLATTLPSEQVVGCAPEPVNGVETVQAACSVSCPASLFSWVGSLIHAASGSRGGVGGRRNRVGVAA
jgi:hypothetical protein